MNPSSNAQPKIAEMYPGIYQSGRQAEGQGGPDLPMQPLNTLLGFDLETYQVPLDHLLPSKKIMDGTMSTRKYKQVVSSIHEIGLIEPLSVIQPDPKKSEFLLLDGHLRVLALKELGMETAPCLMAKDDETFSYNHRINRLSTVQEHYMPRHRQGRQPRALGQGLQRQPQLHQPPHQSARRHLPRSHRPAARQAIYP